MPLTGEQKKSIKRKKKQRKEKSIEEQALNEEEELETELQTETPKDEVPSDSKPKRKSWYIVKEKKNRSRSAGNEEGDGYLIRLTTKNEKFAITQAAISVSKDIRYDGLNEIVRSMLLQAGIVEEPIPFFEFIIDEEILPATSSLHELLHTEDADPEKLIEIEYFECQPVPKPHDSLEHDDWIGAVHCLNGYLLTGCYDNTVQIWTPKRGQLAQCKEAHRVTIDAHKSYVKAVKWLKQSGDNFTFVSGSMDQKAHIWTWNPKTNKANRVSVCDGHTMEITSIGTHDHKYFLTGSWDFTVKVWDSEKRGTESMPAEEDGEVGSKKQKVEDIQLCKTSLEEHTQAVIGVSWMSNTKAISASMDHSMIIWDVNRGASTRTITGNMCFRAMTYSPSKNIAIAASEDRHIRFYDTRADTRNSNIAQGKFAACKKWVTSLSISACYDNLFMSGCQDMQKNVHVWDLRSQKAPVYELSGHTDQVLAVDWSDPDFLASGGSDNSVKVFSILHDGIEVQVI